MIYTYYLNVRHILNHFSMVGIEMLYGNNAVEFVIIKLCDFPEIFKNDLLFCEVERNAKEKYGKWMP